MGCSCRWACLCLEHQLDVPGFMISYWRKENFWLKPRKRVPWEVVRSSPAVIYLLRTLTIPVQLQCAQNGPPPQLGCHQWVLLAVPPVSQWVGTGRFPGPRGLLICSGVDSGQNRTGWAVVRPAVLKQSREWTLNASPSLWARLGPHCPWCSRESWECGCRKWPMESGNPHT
jgi:hypothetical protein